MLSLKNLLKRKYNNIKQNPRIKNARIYLNKEQ